MWNKAIFLTMFLIFSLFIAMLTSPELKNKYSIRQTQVHITPESTSFPAYDLDLLPTFEDLMIVNKANCILPCWWGLTLEETTLQEITTFANETDFGRHLRRSIYANQLSLMEYLRYGEPIVLDFVDNPYDAISPEFRLFFTFDQQDTLIATRIEFRHISDWLSGEADTVSLPMLLIQVDEIPQIYIVRYAPTFSIAEYNMYLIFETAGIWANYHFDLTTDNTEYNLIEPLELCLQLNRTQEIEFRLSAASDFESLDSEIFTTVEALYGITNREFVEFFRANPDECLIVQEQINEEREGS